MKETPDAPVEPGNAPEDTPETTGDAQAGSNQDPAPPDSAPIEKPTAPTTEQGSDGPTQAMPIKDLLAKANEAGAACPIPGAGSPSVESEEVAREMLAGKGIDDDTILTDGAAHHETIDEWQCRVCRAYNLATIDRGGVKITAPLSSLLCWNCGQANWMSVEGGFHAPNILEKIGPPQPARYLEPDSSMKVALNEAQSLLDETQLFPSDADQQDNEPGWPSHLAATIIATGLHIGRKLEQKNEKIDAKVESLIEMAKELVGVTAVVTDPIEASDDWDMPWDTTVTMIDIPGWAPIGGSPRKSETGPTRPPVQDDEK